MPERELWPEGPGSEPVTRIGSWNSMTSTTSTRSGSSDSSYDFLSAEEKECLLFLEETIGSLDTEADSGLSTDESEQATTPQNPPAPQGHPAEIFVQQRLDPRRVTEPRSPPLSEPQGLGFRSGSYSLPRNIHISRNQIRKSTTQTNNHLPRRPGRLSPGPDKEQASQSREPSSLLQESALNLDTALIPPPEAFRDAQPEQGGADNLPKGLGEKSPKPQLHMSISPQKSKKTSSEAMSQTANGKGSGANPGQPQPPPAVSSQPARAADAPIPSGGDRSAQLAPPTVPKSRKLPPNIVLKSSRSSFHSNPQNWLSRHPEVAPGDFSSASSSLQEQRKARKEALEKLGLPQDQDEPSPQLSKPTSSIRLKGAGAQAPSPAPASTPAPETPAAQVSAAVPAAGKAQAPAPGKVPAAKSMPGPIAAASGLTLQESSIPGLRQMNFKSNTLERSGVGLSSYFSAEKDPSSQTSTSLGKDSFLSKVSPSVLRNSRPRPASLGTGKDFAGIRVSTLAGQEPEKNSKRLSYQGWSHDKLPRPSCVSVKISPKGISDEHRREALKKLGLLKE